MNLTKTEIFGINENDDFEGFFIVPRELNERKAHIDVGRKSKSRIDIYIKEVAGNEPHIHLRDEHGNICRIKLRKK